MKYRLSLVAGGLAVISACSGSTSVEPAGRASPDVRATTAAHTPEACRTSATLTDGLQSLGNAVAGGNWVALRGVEAKADVKPTDYRTRGLDYARYYEQFPLSDVEFVYGKPATVKTYAADERMVEVVRASLAGGSTVWIPQGDASTGAVGLNTAFEVNNGQVSVLSPCGTAALTEGLARFLQHTSAAQAGSASPVLGQSETFESLVASPDFGSRLVAFLTQPGSTTTTLAWESVPAADRVIWPGVTPGSVMTTLEHLTLRFDLPEEWYTRRWLVCARTTSGWNPCLTNTTSTTEGKKPVSEVPLDAWADVGANLEIYILDGNSSTDKSSAQLLGRVTPEQRGGATQVRITAPEQMRHALDTGVSSFSGEPALNAEKIA